MSIASVQILMALLLLAFAPGAFACKKYVADSRLSKQDLITNTKDIVLVKAKSFSPMKMNDQRFETFADKDKFDYEMDVVEVLKGDPKRKSITLRAFDSPESKVKAIGSGEDCKNHGGFKTGEMYLVFLNSANKDAIRQITGQSDSWLVEVRTAIGSR